MDAVDPCNISAGSITPASLESSVVIICSGETLEKVSLLSRDPVTTTSSTSRTEEDGTSIAACSSSFFGSDCAPLCKGFKLVKSARVRQQSRFVGWIIVASSSMLAPINCDRTLASRERFARHSNYASLSCHLISLLAKCIAAYDSMPRLQFCRRLKLTRQKYDQSIALACCSASGPEPPRALWPRDFKYFLPCSRCVSVNLATNISITRSIHP